MAARDRLIRRSLRERFVVTMRSGEAFEGLLLDADDRTFTIADGFVLTGRDRHAADGVLYLPRSEVAYMQKPEARG
jgi:hypothetical protein